MFTYVLPALSYLLGSVSTGVVVARLFGLQDSARDRLENPGATNLLRYGGKLAAALTRWSAISSRAWSPSLVARAFTDDAAILALAGLAAFVGHLWPVFFGFHGGKGVATALGVWLALNPLGRTAVDRHLAGGSRPVSLLVVGGARRRRCRAPLCLPAYAPARLFRDDGWP